MIIAAVALGFDLNAWAGPLIPVPADSSDMVAAEPLSPTLEIPRAYSPRAGFPRDVPRANEADDSGPDTSAPIPYYSPPDTSGEAPVVVFGTADRPADPPDANSENSGVSGSSARVPDDASAGSSLSAGATNSSDPYLAGVPNGSTNNDQEAELENSPTPLGDARDYANQVRDEPPLAVAPPPAYYVAPAIPPPNPYSAPYYRPPPVYRHYRPYHRRGALARAFPNHGGNIPPPAAPPVIMNSPPSAVFPYVPPTIPMVRFRSTAMPPASPMLMRTLPRR